MKNEEECVCWLGWKAGWKLVEISKQLPSLLGSVGLQFFYKILKFFLPKIGQIYQNWWFLRISRFKSSNSVVILVLLNHYQSVHFEPKKCQFWHCFKIFHQMPQKHLVMMCFATHFARLSYFSLSVLLWCANASLGTNIRKLQTPWTLEDRTSNIWNICLRFWDWTSNMQDRTEFLIDLNFWPLQL